ncbi:hypothetical protein AB7M47_004760 [Bradyrhizobium elkanii]
MITRRVSKLPRIVSVVGGNGVMTQSDVDDLIDQLRLR